MSGTDTIDDQVREMLFQESLRRCGFRHLDARPLDDRAVLRLLLPLDEDDPIFEELHVVISGNRCVPMVLTEKQIAKLSAGGTA